MALSNNGQFLFVLMAGVVVLLEQVLSKITSEIAPYGVNVVGVILRID